MPIGKISKSGTSFSNAAEYDLAQGKYRKDNKFKKPEILLQNFISSKHYKEIGKEFRELSNENKNCLKPVLKFSVSFDPGEDLTDDFKLNFTKAVMYEMGITNEHQFMITRHSDKAHDHHHILANRVGLDGKVINDSFAINRLETAIDKIEKKFGMSNHLASKRRFVYDELSPKGYNIQIDNFSSNKPKASTRNSKKGVEKKKQFIQNHVDLALNASKSFDQFSKLLKSQNIIANLRFNNNNEISGVSFEFNGYSVKGSALGSLYKASSIDKKIKSNLGITMNDDEFIQNNASINEAEQLRLKQIEDENKKNNKENII